jgi:hypothetical protein
MLYSDEDSSNEYLLTYYGYGIANGYFVLNNGKIHFVHGDFVSMMYTSIKEKLERSSINLP